MPVDFDKCVANKGRVRTIKPAGKDSKKYMHVCYDKKGKSHSGHMKTLKNKGK
jgi:hypothetical protein